MFYCDGALTLFAASSGESLLISIQDARTPERQQGLTPAPLPRSNRDRLEAFVCASPDGEETFILCRCKIRRAMGAASGSLFRLP